MDMQRISINSTTATKLLSRILGYALVFIIVLSIILAVMVALSERDKALWGLRTYVVTSGSMEPSIGTGSVVIVRDTEPSAVQVGDVITYRSSEDLVAHRVIETMPDGTLITKGDANNAADAPVAPDRVSGRVVFSLPYLGTLALFVHSIPGLILLIVVPACALLGMYLRDIWGDDDKVKIKPVGLSVLLIGLSLCVYCIPGVHAYYADRSNSVGIQISGPPEEQEELLPLLSAMPLILDEMSASQSTDTTEASGDAGTEEEGTEPGTEEGAASASTDTTDGDGDGTTTTTTEDSGEGTGSSSVTEEGTGGTTGEDEAGTSTGTTLAP